MPSYIEIDQNVTFPSSSGAGKVILGVNANNQVTVTDNVGSTSVVGGPPYKVYTAYYNVEEGILDVYENTLGEIEFSATSPTILAITSNSLFGGITGSGSPEKAYVTITNSTGAFVDFITYLVNSSTIQIVSSVNMFSESVKFFIEIRVYN